jgi:Flp pilus assembly pilin Flp
MRIRRATNKGQNLLEYALILGIVTVALLSMQTYFKRGINSVIKVVADDYSGVADDFSDGIPGQLVGEVEKAIKQQQYAEYYKETGATSTVNSVSSVSGIQWREDVKGWGVRTRPSSSQVTTSDSFWIGTDYYRRWKETPKSSGSGKSSRD